jgi:glycosyltransferase involved in cell wall biosynthesis
MSKNTCAIYGPAGTFSGYGSHCRDIAKAIIELKKDEWDIKILPCRWGNTPMNFIDENPEWKFLEEYFVTQLTSQPDYMFWVTIPSEAQSVGKWNCLITAGIESTVAPAEWVEGCQRMDLVLGSSKHTIDILRQSKFEKRDTKTQQLAGIAEWTKEGDILFEGARTDVYKPIELNHGDIFNNINDIPENFCYLFNSMWIGNAPIGEDRKNIGLLIKSFYEVFKNKKSKPGLILKTTTFNSSYMDRNEILKRINEIKSTINSTDLPNIYLIHGDISDAEINELYNHPKIKAMVNLTKGEGWGRSLLEFSLTNKPIITTNWSGHVDFLNSEFTTLLPGEMTNIHPAAANNMLLKEAKWFSVDLGHVGYYLKDVFENYKKYLEKAKRQGHYSRTNFSYDKMKEKLDSLLNKHTPPLPVKTQLVLPSLKKIQLPVLNEKK